MCEFERLDSVLERLVKGLATGQLAGRAGRGPVAALRVPEGRPAASEMGKDRGIRAPIRWRP